MAGRWICETVWEGSEGRLLFGRARQARRKMVGWEAAVQAVLGMGAEKTSARRIEWSAHAKATSGRNTEREGSTCWADM